MDRIRIILVVLTSLFFVKGQAFEREMADGIYWADTTREEAMENEAEREQDENREKEEKERYYTERTINFDLGFSNYLYRGKFPDATNELFTLNPLGSSNFAIASNNNSHIVGPLFLDWGGSLSWYQFKFQDPGMRIVKDADQVFFFQDTSGYTKYRKSMFKVTYLNAYIVPMFYVGKVSRSKGFKGWSHGHGGGGFRFGAGPYAGYRLMSKAKLYFVEDKRHVIKDRGNFYLNNFRYGIRGQVGWNSVDVYFNYDLNTLFERGRGPELNTFSFGIIF